MPYTPIEIDRKNLNIMGINFGSARNFKATANAHETIIPIDFDPSPTSIEITHDYLSGAITIEQLNQLTKEKAYAG